MEKRLSAPKLLRLLMIDDDRQDFEAVQKLLAQSQDPEYVLDWASDYAEGLSRCAEGRTFVVWWMTCWAPARGSTFGAPPP